MSEERLKRKITIILATDVFGYSKHIEEDETLTIKTYNDREVILLNLIKEFRGRVFNTGGDSVFAEFSSAVDAVECAFTFQNKIHQINDNPDTKCKLKFRIGVNMGDVVEKGSNLLGDGVNIAARLEAMAQPNGVCISKSVYDLVAPKTDLLFNDIGIQKVKENKFHAFDLMMKHSKKREKSNQSFHKRSIIGFSATFVVLFAIFVFYFWQVENKPSNDVYVHNSSEPTLLIYPFENLSDKNDSNRFAAAFTDSMIQNLSQYSGIVVLSGSTSNHAIQNNISDSEMNSKYGATLLVRGSIQSIGSSSRVGVRMIDLEKNIVAWSDKYQFNEDEIFDIQDKIGTEILNQLHLNIITGSLTNEFIKKFGTLENLTIVLNARNEWRKFTPSGHDAYWRYIKQLEENLGENSPALYNQKAWGIYQRIGLGLSENIGDDKAKLFELADADIETYGSSQAYALRALIEGRFSKDGCGKSIELIRKAIEVGNTNDALTISGAIERKCGNIDYSIQNLKRALKITPNDNGFFIRRQLAGSLYMKENLRELENLVEPLLEQVDIDPAMVALLAYAKLKNGEKKLATKIFEKSKKIGLSEGHIKRVLFAGEPVDTFFKEMSSIGSLEP